MSDLLISYNDCLRFLGIDSETAKDFEGTLCILPSGITRIDPTRAGVPLLPAEIDALVLAGQGPKAQERPEEYRGARQFDKIPIGAPLITFPEPWSRFRFFIDWAGWTGYIDAVEAVDWLLKRGYPSEAGAEIQTPTPPIPAELPTTKIDTQPGQAELPAMEGVTVTLPHLNKGLEAVFGIMRNNWTNPDPRRLPKQQHIAEEIDTALGWQADKVGNPSRNARAIATLIKPDNIKTDE